MDKRLLLILPVVVSVLAVASFANFDFETESIQTQSNSNPFVDKVGLRENVEFILYDQNGNIKQRDVTHNKVVTHGENCVLKMVFGLGGGAETGTGVCVGAITHGFSVIGLGEDNTAVSDGDLDLINPADETGLATPLQGTLAWTNSTNGSFGSVIISASFTNTGATETINEAVLYNSTTTATNSIYSRVVAGSPYVVANGDTLTVNWTQEIGSATVP